MKFKILTLFSLFFAFSYSDQKKFLIFGGKSGWIGQKIMITVQEQGHIAVAAESRLEDRQNIEKEITSIKPDFIINAAGVIGRPNVDWCEDHRQETIRSNIIGALNLADIAYLYHIPMINIGTGCIYNYDAEHAMYSGKGFTEDDKPNFDGAFYCKTKIMLESMLSSYPHVLYLRVRLPVASDFYRGNLIVKLTKYQKVVNIPNSITILDDLVPLIPQMALRGLTGIYNFVNPGVISHNELLDLYKEHVDHNFSYQNFSLAEQGKILKAQRCYNQLDVTKLLKEFPNIPDVQSSLVQVVKKMKNLKNIRSR